MAKNLDGIKKLNTDEIRKNRKIVLSYIGEKDKDQELIKEPKTASRIASVFNKVDGIKLNRIFSANKPKVKNTPDGPAPANNQANKKEIVEEAKREAEEKLKTKEVKKNLRGEESAKRAELLAKEQTKAEEAKRWQEILRLEDEERQKNLKLEENRRLEKERAKQIKIEREEFIKKEMAERDRLKALEKTKAEEARKRLKEEELAKKEIAEKARREAEEKVKAEEARKLHEKLRLEEKKKEEKRIRQENERLEKIKREEEINRIKQEIKLAKMETARKRKLKRQKAIKLFKKNFSNRLKEIFFAVKRNFVYGILYLFMFLIIGYAVFCLLVLRFEINDNIMGRMARIIPVPAVITSQGIIDYNDFRDLRNNYANLNSADKKNSLARWVILKNLIKKYGLPADLSGRALALAFAADEDFNEVGLSRIKKISQLLKAVGDLEKLSKYADEYSEVIYYNNGSAAEKFGPAVLNYNVNQTSDIIFSENGYYIAQIVDSKDGQLGVRYLFVGANTLDQYVNKKMAKIKIFILTN